MVLDKSSSKKAFAGKKVRYLSYLLAGALSREGQLVSYLSDSVILSKNGQFASTWKVALFVTYQFLRSYDVEKS